MNNADTTILSQAAAVAEQGAHVPPGKAASSKGATRKKGAPKGQRGAKKAAKGASKAGAKPRTDRNQAAKLAAKSASVPREFSKKAIVLDLLRRKQGATIEEIRTATGWQRHTVRGFVSVLGKTTAIASTRRGDGARVYAVVAQAGKQ